jgi:hypothetical protein
MPCLSNEDGTLYVCLPSRIYFRRMLRCRKCKRLTRHVVGPIEAWYEPYFFCCVHEKPPATWDEAVPRPQQREVDRQILVEALGDGH